MSWIFDLFLQNKHKVAIIYNDREYSYLDLLNSIELYYKDLTKNNISQGDIVAINTDYSFEAISIFFALVKNKNIIVPIISTIDNEINTRLNITKSDFLIKIKNKKIEYTKLATEFDKHNFIKALRDNHTTGLILFSSGTTGNPKAMLHNFENLINSSQGKKQKNINILIFLTFDHIGGIDTLIRAFSIGATITIPKIRNPKEVCKLIEKYKITVLPSSPTFLNLLLISNLHKKYDLSSLRIIAFGAEPMPETLLLRLNGIFPNIELQQKFGTSETNAIKVKSKSNNSPVSYTHLTLPTNREV